MLGEEHPDTLISTHELAVRPVQGRYGEAEPLLIKALEILKPTFLRHLPRRARVVFDLWNDNPVSGCNVVQQEVAKGAKRLAPGLSSRASSRSTCNRWERMTALVYQEAPKLNEYSYQGCQWCV